jgi:NAD(P)-dependent dehydrogenase (short-subunit alcohol dehydrogenase family)
MSGLVIIMGANGGIGESVAQIWARDYTTEGGEIITTGRATGSAQVDVTNPEDIKKFLAQIGDRPVKAFLYAIGSIVLKPLKNTTDQDFFNAYDVNLLGAMRVLRGLEANLKVGQGSVVLFSSIAVNQGFTNHTVISAAKGAVEGFAKALAAEWAPHVRVNVIAPSLTDSGIAKPLTSSPQMAQAIANLHPIPRLGAPQDAGETAAFLMSEKSSWITGQIFHIDGGRSTLRVKG